MAYNSKYTGAEVEALLDKLNDNTYATEEYVAQQIAAIVDGDTTSY